MQLHHLSILFLSAFRLAGNWDTQLKGWLHNWNNDYAISHKLVWLNGFIDFIIHYCATFWVLMA